MIQALSQLTARIFLIFKKLKKILHSHWVRAVSIHLKSVSIFGLYRYMSFTRVTQRKYAPCFSNGFVSRNVCSLLSPPQHSNTAEDVEVQVWVATVETPIKIVCVFWALNWFLILDCHNQALSPSVAATYCNHFCHLLHVSLQEKRGYPHLVIWIMMVSKVSPLILSF